MLQQTLELQYWIGQGTASDIMSSRGIKHEKSKKKNKYNFEFLHENATDRLY